MKRSALLLVIIGMTSSCSGQPKHISGCLGGLLGTHGGTLITVFPEGAGEVVRGDGHEMLIVADGVAASYKLNESVKLRAIPNTGWSFDRWEGNVTNENSKDTKLRPRREGRVTCFFKHGEEPWW